MERQPAEEKESEQKREVCNPESVTLLVQQDEVKVSDEGSEVCDEYVIRAESGEETSVVIPPVTDSSQENASEEGLPREDDSGENEKRELEMLRKRVAELEKELTGRKEQWERAGKEWNELIGCFPDITPEAVPDSVWQQVRSGVPLAAAYALYDRKLRQRNGNAQVCNDRNGQQSPGGLQDGADGYLSPTQVRAMSRREVRENYDRIFASMRHWQ